MLTLLISRFLQHITHQNNWSRSHLMPFVGQSVQFDFVLAKANLLILEDGSLNTAADTTTPDAVIHIPPSLALRILAQDQAATMQIKIDGDTHLATELSKILQQMRWDFEEDLSHIIGDIAANKTVAASKKIAQTAKTQVINLSEMLTEYWQEEVPMLAKKCHVEQLSHDIDTLKSDVARFEKRLQKLNRTMQQNKHRESP